MNRFFLPPSSFVNDEIVFPEAISRQIANVLRLKPESMVIALDGKGLEYSIQLLEVTPKQTSGKILSVQPNTTEPHTRVRLLLCLTQREKFEWMLQKCTELGTTRFVPVISSRSLVQERGGQEKKLERWRRIVQEAAEQCGRGKIPAVEEVAGYEAGLRRAGGGLKLALWEQEHARSLRQVLQPGTGEVAALIGPEGGLSEAEVEQAQAAGFQAVTLGRRILRMETAAMTAAALILYELG